MTPRASIVVNFAIVSMRLGVVSSRRLVHSHPRDSMGAVARAFQAASPRGDLEPSRRADLAGSGPAVVEEEAADFLAADAAAPAVMAAAAARSLDEDAVRIRCRATPHIPSADRV